jgi:uncharacterized membrane protein YadS
MSLSYALPLFLITSIIVISQLWLNSPSWINGISYLPESVIMILMGLSMQLLGRRNSRKKKG